MRKHEEQMAAKADENAEKRLRSEKELAQEKAVVAKVLASELILLLYCFNNLE